MGVSFFEKEKSFKAFPKLINKEVGNGEKGRL